MYFYVYLIFLILCCDNKLLLIHIMIRQKTHFRKSKNRFIPQTIFHLNLMLLLMMEIHVEYFFIFLVKFKAEGRIPLNQNLQQKTQQNKTGLKRYSCILDPSKILGVFMETLPSIYYETKYHCEPCDCILTI